VRGLCRAKQDSHLVPLVNALEPLQAKSKTILLIQGTRHALFYVHDSVGDTVDVDNHLSNSYNSISDSSVAQHEVLVLDHHGHLVSIVLWNVVQGGSCWDGVQSMGVDSPIVIFNLEGVENAC
jgi:hypothetical protein